MAGVPLAVFVAEKSRFIEPYRVESLLRRSAEVLEGLEAEAALIVYAGRAYPMLDPTAEPGRLIEAYSEAPILPGSPEPSPALREAADMITSYRDPLTGPVVVVVLWSTKSRPRRALRVAEFYLASLGARILVGLLTSKRRKWIHTYFQHAGDVVYLEPPGRGSRLASSLEALLGG